jgi:hypothetical protein
VTTIRSSILEDNIIGGFGCYIEVKIRPKVY